MTAVIARDRPPVARVAVTAPPRAWFHGVGHAFYEIYRRALTDLGVETFDVPIDVFVARDEARIAVLIEELRAFRPELALGLPTGAHALVCRARPRRDGWQPNVFTDILDIPLLCLWDHAPLEFADQLLSPHPDTPAASRAGAMFALRSVLTHPRVIHWSRDSGQTEIMRELALQSPAAAIVDGSPALGREQAAPAARTGAPRVAFVGHFYQSPQSYPQPALAALAERAIATWRRDGGALWHVLRRLIDSQPFDDLALDLDQTYFWSYAHRLILHTAQTARRLEMLGQAGVRVICYGNLHAGLPGVPANLVAEPGHIPFGAALDAALAQPEIVVDVASPGFINGYGHKCLQAFDAGGFMLTERKQDFVAAFGDVGEAVSYRDGEELAAKIDFYLARPRRRRELVDAMRDRIDERYRVETVVGRVLESAAVLARSRSSAPRQPRAPIEVADLLPRLRPYSSWRWRSVRNDGSDVCVTTPDDIYAHAAKIDVPRPPLSAHQPHLSIELSVEKGAVSLQLWHGGAVEPEPALGWHVGPTQRPLTLDIQLPNDAPATLVLCNHANGPSHARISRAMLCDGRA